MLNYIATENTSKLIHKICKNQNILILHETKDITDINKYLKERKVNFNLIKYFVIEIECLNNLEDEIIESIYNFSRLYIKTRIIILAQGFNEQNNLLNQLYEKEIYNIINSVDEQQIEEQLIKCFSKEGIPKNEVKRFQKTEKVKVKDSKLKRIKQNILSKRIKKDKQIKNDNLNKKQQDPVMHRSEGVYFFAILLEAVTRFIKLICYIAVFLLTSIGITILLNSESREMAFQIFSLK